MCLEPSTWMVEEPVKGAVLPAKATLPRTRAAQKIRIRCFISDLHTEMMEPFAEIFPSTDTDAPENLQLFPSVRRD